jgi:hypothetical protein
MSSWRVPQASALLKAQGNRYKPQEAEWSRSRRYNSNLQPLIGQNGNDILYQEGGGRTSHLGLPSHRSCCRAPQRYYSSSAESSF